MNIDTVVQRYTLIAMQDKSTYTQLCMNNKEHMYSSTVSVTETTEVPTYSDVGIRPMCKYIGLLTIIT